MLIGHGGWDVTGEPAYAKVPRGTSLTFYTENFKLLYAGNAAEITSQSQLFQDAEAAHTVAQFMQTPNYTLYALEAELRQYFKENLSADVTALWVGDEVTDGVRLCTNAASQGCIDGFHDCDGILAHPDVQGQQLYWIACREVKLNEVGGALVGVNNAQNELDNRAATPDVTPDGTAGMSQEGVTFYNNFDTTDDESKLTAWDSMPESDHSALRLVDQIREWATTNGR
jgi:hypothetical protein